MPEPIKVLHVLGSLKCGGAETWFVQLLDHLCPQRIHVDVLVHNPGGEYESRVQSKNSKIVYCGRPTDLCSYTSGVRLLLRENGPYHIVHSHLQLFTGWVLRNAHKCGVPGRIAHARNTQDGKSTGFQRAVYSALMRYFIRRHATHLFAVSNDAAEGAFGKKLSRSCGFEVMTGIDFSPFQTKIDRGRVRAELGIPDNTLTIGHVGSFRRQKNHAFLIDIIQALQSLHPQLMLLLVGTGALKDEIVATVKRMHIDKKVRFLGDRRDVSEILRIMDVFVFPSFYEGLPRVLIEAQAAGVPCVASSTITSEVAVESGCPINFLDLTDTPQTWAQTILTAAQQPVLAQTGAKAIRQFEARGLSIRANAHRLSELYESIASTPFRTMGR
jgi:glycosyltransferase involved in cell wall biosynthesis